MRSASRKRYVKHRRGVRLRRGSMIPHGEKRPRKVRTLELPREGLAQLSCAACGEHVVLEVDGLDEKPWRGVVCERCVYENVRFTVTCARGHDHVFTTDQLWDARTAREIGRVTHCRCNARGVRVVSVRLGNGPRSAKSAPSSRPTRFA